MSAMSNYLENKIIDATLRGIEYTAPTKVYLALFNSDPTDEGTGYELAGGGYIRQEISFSAPLNGAASNATEIMFPQAQVNWGTISHIAIFDAQIGGNMLYHGLLSNPKTIQLNDQLKVNAGDITVTLA